jgi:malonyl-CoA O-methyltransferase
MPGPHALPPASVALPERAAAQRRFDRASGTFDSACAAHDHARSVLLNRLEWFDLEPQFVLDASCGTGRSMTALREHYPRARILGVDLSAKMLAAAHAANETSVCLRGDNEALPCASRSVDVVFANLALPWCDPQRMLAQFARVLRPEGLLLMSTTGPATLAQIRHAWRGADDLVHVHASPDLQTLGDLVARAGLREPVLDSDRVTLRYSGVDTLHDELQAVGASNCAGGRRRTLTGKARFAAYTSELRRLCGPGTIDVDVEFYYVQAWGVQDSAGDGVAPASFQGIPVRTE